MDALKNWNAKTPDEKTFALFKKHMRAEHHALKQVGALSIQESSFYQANMVQQVLSQQNALQDNLQASIDQQVKDSLLSALTDYTSSMDEPDVNVANNISSTAPDASTAAILDLIAKLTTKVDALGNQANSGDINPRTGKKFKRYCWSCGCCQHWGKDCPTKKTGHKDDANFKNRMGGSNRNCLPPRE